MIISGCFVKPSWRYIFNDVFNCHSSPGSLRLPCDEFRNSSNLPGWIIWTMETFWWMRPQFSHLAFEWPAWILLPCSAATISRRTLEIYGGFVRDLMPRPQVAPVAQVQSAAVDCGQFTRVPDARGPLCPVACPPSVHAATGGLLRPERFGR